MVLIQMFGSRENAGTRDFEFMFSFLDFIVRVTEPSNIRWFGNPIYSRGPYGQNMRHLPGLLKSLTQNRCITSLYNQTVEVGGFV